MARKTKAQLAEQQEAIERLREWLNPGDTVYCVLRHVSRSGMQRLIDLYKMTDDGPIWLTYSAAKALDWPQKDSHLKVDGCGMDMGFHTVYSLSRVIFRDGFNCTGKDGYGRDRCPSNDHSNERGDDRNFNPDRLHSDPGYALRSDWL